MAHVVCWLIRESGAHCNYEAHDGSDGQIASFTRPNIMIICQQQISSGFTWHKKIILNKNANYQ